MIRIEIVWTLGFLLQISQCAENLSDQIHFVRSNDKIGRKMSCNWTLS